MSSFGIASKSDDGRVFQQQQHVSDLAGLAQIGRLPLQPKPFGIINLTELDDRNHVAVEIIGPQRMPADSGLSMHVYPWMSSATERQVAASIPAAIGRHISGMIEFLQVPRREQTRRDGADSGIPQGNEPQLSAKRWVSREHSTVQTAALCIV
jgi:hypothetical protein